MERRDFIRKSVLATAAFAIVPRHVLGGPGQTAPSDELTKAVIGVGGMGNGHLGRGLDRDLHRRFRGHLPVQAAVS